MLDLDGKRVRWLDRPHVPHNWDAGICHEETTGTTVGWGAATSSMPHAEEVQEARIPKCLSG